MALYPFFDNSYLLRPTRILDQHFGLSLDPEDFIQPLTTPMVVVKCPAGYLRRWRTDASQKDVGSTVKVDKEKFQANLDVQQFNPEEITVKVTADNTITIEGKHEEKQDEHGFISRHFVRKYVLPKDVDVNRIESKLSSDGVLSIVAPKVVKGEIEHKEIPITQTGEPVKQVQQKTEAKKSEQ